MCRKRPRMAEWVFQDTYPAAIGLILDRSSQLRHGGRRLLNHRINIVDIDENIYWCASNRLRTAKINLWKLIGKHDRGVTYSKFGMPDLSVWLPHQDHLSRSKGSFVKFNGLSCVPHAQVRRGTT